MSAINMQLLLQPFAYEYMVKAMTISLLVGAVCGLLSVFLMLKGWSLIGDALSHSVVPGVAIAYIFNLPYVLGAFFTGMLAAAAMLVLRKLAFLRQDAIIGFVFSSFFALGLLLISLHPTSINIKAIIYGDILGVSTLDMVQMVAISLVSLAVISVKWRDLMLLFFDETQAVASGLSVRQLQVIFFALVSAAVVASLQAVGAVLVIALLITPGATAFLLAERFGRVLWIASAIGALSSIGGAYLSYFLDMPTGALIVLLQAFIFAIVFLFSPKKGFLRKFIMTLITKITSRSAK